MGATPIKMSRRQHNCQRFCRKPPGVIASAAHQVKKLNAESVTAIATGFLKRIGHKGGLKPKRVSLEEGIYTVEVEIKKLNALIRVDAETQEITAYEIQPKGGRNLLHLVFS